MLMAAFKMSLHWETKYRKKKRGKKERGGIVAVYVWHIFL